ncbi:hypothetical protein B0T36_04485 [Nocardia donostiensis]|uniref:hypothetical protein n=1 Tax=Nocardia donostiensis TaxID=1538463 RepID=UPI0009D9161E|nr:hypothetical protein [Nocardia donostiensis]OQS16895.1 hypothetical protein B0T36_04485 [Nocardia donostiensis]
MNLQILAEWLILLMAPTAGVLLVSSLFAHRRAAKSKAPLPVWVKNAEWAAIALAMLVGVLYFAASSV